MRLVIDIYFLVDLFRISFLPYIKLTQAKLCGKLNSVDNYFCQSVLLLASLVGLFGNRLIPVKKFTHLGQLGPGIFFLTYVIDLKMSERNIYLVCCMR